MLPQMQRRRRAMPKVGTVLRPTHSLILGGGRNTKFLVPCLRFIQNKGIVQVGQVEILAKGEYHFQLGDRIKMTRMNGFKVWRSRNDKPIFTVYADIEFIPKDSLQERGELLQKLADDVPEEYYG